MIKKNFFWMSLILVMFSWGITVEVSACDKSGEPCKCEACEKDGGAASCVKCEKCVKQGNAPKDSKCAKHDHKKCDKNDKCHKDKKCDKSDSTCVKHKDINKKCCKKGDKDVKSVEQSFGPDSGKKEACH